MESRSAELAGKLAMVTGAAGPTGFAIARALAEDGLRVLLVDLDRGRLETGRQDCSEVSARAGLL